MHYIEARNAHQMLPVALHYMLEKGKGAESRNGPVLSLEEPCAFMYRNPKERVVFHEERNANPFFHLMECLWMMAGRNDVAFVAKYVKTMSNFSDDGVTFNAAYGHRWRSHFGKDQIARLVQELKADKTTRRAVLGIWDAHHDLGLLSRDLPCNIAATFRIVDGALDMTVFNRSNDMVWGALGANVVHFSFLQEWMATAIGIDVGRYWQISTNMHLYVRNHIDLADSLGAENVVPCPYEAGNIVPFPVMSVEPDQWFQDLTMIMDEGPGTMGLKEPFFKRVVCPMMLAWDSYKAGDWQMALSLAYEIQDPAWQQACQEWLHRKRSAKARSDYVKDDGVIYD